MPGDARELGYAGRVGRAIASILLALVISFGAVACGEDSNEEFKDRYNQAVRPLSQLGDDVVASLTSAGQASDRELARRLESFADRADRVRGNLSDLEPPEGTQDEFDELVAALKRSEADLRAVAASAKEGDRAAANEATEKLVESGQDLRSAESDFRNAVED
jgi:methyl-accepting chemotaxis protein